MSKQSRLFMLLLLFFHPTSFPRIRCIYKIQSLFELKTCAPREIRVRKCDTSSFRRVETRPVVVPGLCSKGGEDAADPCLKVTTNPLVPRLRRQVRRTSRGHRCQITNTQVPSDLSVDRRRPFREPVFYIGDDQTPFTDFKVVIVT